jgi:hypothetical protein
MNTVAVFDWINASQEKLWAIVNKVMNSRVPQKVGELPPNIPYRPLQSHTALHLSFKIFPELNSYS